MKWLLTTLSWIGGGAAVGTGAALAGSGLLLWRLYAFVVFVGGVLFPIVHSIVRWEALMARDATAVSIAFIPLVAIFYYLRRKKKKEDKKDIYSRWTHAHGYFVAAGLAIIITTLIFVSQGVTLPIEGTGW